MEKHPLARVMIVAWVLWLFAALYSPVLAQQPTSVNPTAQSVKEQELLKELNKVQGRGSIPDTKSYVIQQPAGRDWRQFHEVTLHWIAGIAILGMPVLLVGFFLGRGMIRIKSGRSGSTLVRFNGFERFVHWLTAVCFIVLGLTGLNITFGKELLLPYLGPEAFTEWSQWAKYTHNYASFPFTIGVVLIFLLWIAWNLPTLTDVRWLREGGGIIGHEHPPARRFNAGQKLIYWAVVLIGGTMAISGYILMFPFYETDISQMQTAQMVHAIAGVVFVAIMLAHIYIGTIGMEGAFEAMGSGEVDVNWAREHHSLWLENQVAKGRVKESPAPDGRAAPAE
jgi:formate dehydrogenase subunit gamma